tara:strand:- start:64 stop:1149 length:1086 start_codon:yes stop_codon:yes gene_type:complete
MTTTAEKYNASNSLVQPVTSDETQSPTGNTFHTVLLNSKTFTVRTDRRSAFLGNKNLGFGMHIFQNGNIQLQAGPKKDGNGKFNVVSRGGQIIKTGPTVIERTGFKKSFLQKDYDDEIIAAEETNYGDVVQVTHGTLRIKAANIVLEAADTFSIISGDQITVQSKGSIHQDTGKYTSIFDTKEEVGDRAKIKVLQRVMNSNDPRSSDDIVIAGHVNRRFGGDYRVEAGGISATYIQGNKALPGVPLVLNRSVGLHIGLNAPSVGFGGISIKSLTGAVDINAGSNMALNAGALFNITTGGFTDIKSGGDISMSSAKGVGIASGGLTVPSAAVGDVNIRAAKDVKITATAGVIDMDATMIYLN